MDRRIEIRFFDQNLKIIGEEDAYQGLEFTTRWTKYGTFQIFVDKLTKQMKVGNYIMLDNDRKKTGIIKRIECSDEEESGVPITISGYTLLHLLTQRITYPPAGLAYHSFYEPAENIICGLVTANAVDAADKSRNIPMLSVKASKGLRGQPGPFYRGFQAVHQGKSVHRRRSGGKAGVRAGDSL